MGSLQDVTREIKQQHSSVSGANCHLTPGYWGLSCVSAIRQNVARKDYFILFFVDE